MFQACEERDTHCRRVVRRTEKVSKKERETERHSGDNSAERALDQKSKRLVSTGNKLTRAFRTIDFRLSENR